MSALRRLPALLQRRCTATLTPITTRTPVEIVPSPEEKAASSLNQHNLEIAVRHLHHDGLVVINDVVPHRHLDHLNARMVQDALELQARGADGPFNYNRGNLQQDAPPVAEYFHPSVFTNPIATQVTSAVLGPRPQWTFCSANSAMPPARAYSPQRQPVHSDADFDHPSHPFALVVNIPLVSMDPRNGSTEVWLGTHKSDFSAQLSAHGDRASGRITESLVAQQRESRPPVQPVISKGAIVIRDLRLWHAGMPNYTADVRVMLAMIHFAPWYRNPMRLRFGHDVRPVLDDANRHGKLGLRVPVDWVAEDEILCEYMNRGFGNSYDFNQAS